MAAIKWSNRYQQAFDYLKRLCTTTPILAYVDFTHPFKLHTNACGSGLGAVLYQTHEDGMDPVIAYASGSLTEAKSHYLAHKLEFLTLQGAVVEKFHEYLHGLTFDVYTDNNPLIYVLTMPKQVTDGWPACPTTIFGYITEWVKLTLIQMPYWGCPHWGACLTTQGLTSRSW